VSSGAAAQMQGQIVAAEASSFGLLHLASSTFRSRAPRLPVWFGDLVVLYRCCLLESETCSASSWELMSACRVETRDEDAAKDGNAMFRIGS
jgi:hypothetical protein